MKVSFITNARARQALRNLAAGIVMVLVVGRSGMVGADAGLFEWNDRTQAPVSIEFLGRSASTFLR